MNSSIDKLERNLTNNDFKYLTEEFGFKNLELFNKKMLILIITWTVLKDFRKKYCLIKNVFVTRTSGDNGKKLGGHRSHEDYLTCKKIWNEFNMKNAADYHEHYLKNDVLLLADVFKNFVDTYLEFYRVDPCHYFISPGLS